MGVASTVLGWVVLILASLGIGVPAAHDEDGASDPKDAWCESTQAWSDGKRFGHCEVREVRLAANRDQISVDARPNGGITVTGWNRDEILVRAKIQVWTADQDEARSMAEEITLETDGPTIHATGPEWQPSRRRGEEGTSWSVSYRIYVPHGSNLDLRTLNGSITVTGVNGTIELDAQNGALGIRRVSGEVRGRTTNGSLAIELGGDRWKGEGLDLVTTNGQVALTIPKNYSARLETGTTNGRLRADYPVEVHGERTKRISTDLGRGGATVRAITTNGAVVVTQGD